MNIIKYVLRVYFSATCLLPPMADVLWFMLGITNLYATKYIYNTCYDVSK